jgi:uncharacterized protein
VVVAVAAAGVLAAAAWAVLQQLKVGAVWKAGGAAAAAALPTVVADVRARIDRREHHDRRLVGLLRLWTLAGGPRVRDVADMVALGVTPVAALTPAAESATLAGTATPYVRRAIDSEVDRAFTQDRLVVLVGDSKAGKSRTAFEAMRRHFSERLLLVPASRQALAELAELRVALPASVLWLDELDTYLGADGLTVQVLEQLSAAGPLMILGTMRAAQYARYRAEQEVTLLERKVLERAVVLSVPRRLDAQEQAWAVEQAGDPRIAAALVQLDRYGLAEYLAAGPALVDRWRTGQSVEVEPVGAAIVAAAVDWRRTGRSTPAPRGVLEELYPVYLEDRAPAQLTAEAFAEGLGWATQRVFATAALLAEEPAGLVVFDYLVDYVQRQEPARGVPDRTWEAAVAQATDPGETFQVAIAAYESKRQDIAEQALRVVAATDTLAATLASYNLGVVFREQGRLEEAESWFRSAADAGESAAAFNLAYLFRAQGRLEEAETWYRTAADAGDTRAAINLGNLLQEQDRLEEAETWFRSAADAGDTRAAYNLACLFGAQGRLEEAETWYRTAASAGDIRAANNLGNLLRDAHRLQEAETWYRTAAEAGESVAAFNLANLLDEQDRVTEAEAWHRTAAEAGHSGAANNLGVRLLGMTRLDEAEGWWRAAAEEGHIGAAYNLGNLLRELGRLEEAEKWYRTAAAGDIRVGFNLGLLLRHQGRLEEAEIWWRAAAEAGHTGAIRALERLKQAD